MIHIVGSSGTSEYEAASALRELISRTWPTSVNSGQDNITIIAGAKCHGQKTRDLDLILLANFGVNRTYAPFLAFANPRNDGELERPEAITIDSFCAVIEVKEHPPEKVKFVGTRVSVFYDSLEGRREHDASQQNEDQMYALIKYLKANGIKPPYITPLIWLRNVPNVSLPKRPHNILGGEATWELFINVIGQMSPPRFQEGVWRISANHVNEGAIKQVSDLMTTTLQATQLDRRRMEQINQRVTEEQNLQNIIGNKLLILRGRGGTGKTVRLLQLAKSLYESTSARVLILTYNKALVADLRRLMTMMGISDGSAYRSIQIQTVHSFFYAILRNLDVISQAEDDFLKNYEKIKIEALEMLQVGALDIADIARLKTSNKQEFSWDYVFIDEAQDWPEDERTILFKLYPHKIFAVADGVDQLIRSQQSVNWRGDLLNDQFKIVPLKTCLRMKAGLTRFVSTFAGELGLPQSEWVANDEVPGGRVIILEGQDCLTDRKLFEEFIEANRQSGNSPVDMLFCIPPQIMRSRSDSEYAESLPAIHFRDWGWSVWDGASSDARDTYATSSEQLRIVQYDSCRGLEGWMSFNFSLDDFYHYKLEQLTQKPANQSIDETLIRLQVARWLLIPLTRAMDTLIIHIGAKDSLIRNTLRVTASRHPGFVEWRSVG